MAAVKIQHVKTISEYHELRGLPKAEHSLISVFDMADVKRLADDGEENNLILDFYHISVKKNISGKIKYGQSEYDFDEGTMFFVAPKQVIRITANTGQESQPSGWSLLIHPDFLWNTHLAATIKNFDFFNYSVDEALFLSPKEELILNSIIENISREYNSTVDAFSKHIIISQIESLLNYSERFYNRQFITREQSNHQILRSLEVVLADYFNSDDLISRGLPTVSYIAGALNISPSYLNSLLKLLSNQTTQQHIHNKLIDKAKEKLSTTQLSVSEIAYELGFEHLQSFSKLFKMKTNQSPLQFRASFN
jgi:AraC family transcriptional activator of pobA